jgi:hypothetical protein
MRLRAQIERLFAKQVSELTDCADFQALENGTAAKEDYDRFIANVVRAHINAPQFVAFLYALAPPVAAESRLQNLLEELHHPSLLRQFAAGAGLAQRLPELEALAADDVRRAMVEPLLYGTLKDLGLAALCEVVAFEYMLSRIATRIVEVLAAHRGLSAVALKWWTEHSEVDVQHAEQGLDDLEAYVRHYGFTEQDATTILEMTMRENVFIKRYFGELALARAMGLVQS